MRNKDWHATSMIEGMRAVVHPLPGRESVAVGFWFKTGGRYEEDAVKGAAHFLEHIVFKGSRQFNGTQIKQKIEGVGGSLNAFTAEEQTCFYAKVPAAHVDTTLEVLADMVFFPTVPSRELIKEKGVILEEIKMYKDLPQYYVLERLDELLWPNHPLGKAIIGSPESVGAMSRKTLRAFHHRFYGRNQALLTVCGAVSQSRVRRVLKRWGMADVFESSAETQPLPWPASSSPEPLRPACAFERRPIEQMHVALGAPAYSVTHPDRYALRVLNILLGGNMSSRLFDEVREKRGLAYSISSAVKSFSDTGAFLVWAGVECAKVEDAVKLIRDQLFRVQRRPPGQKEFERSRDYLMGQILLGLEDTLDHMFWVGDAVMALGRVRSKEEVLRKIRRVTPGDLSRVARDLFHPAAFRLSVVGPLTPMQENGLRGIIEA